MLPSKLSVNNAKLLSTSLRLEGRPKLISERRTDKLKYGKRGRRIDQSHSLVALRLVSENPLGFTLHRLCAPASVCGPKEGTRGT